MVHCCRSQCGHHSLRIAFHHVWGQGLHRGVSFVWFHLHRKRYRLPNLSKMTIFHPLQTSTSYTIITISTTNYI